MREMKHDGGHYLRLLGMAVLSFVSMYCLMYAMVDRLENVYGNLNQAYMAGLMTAPMVIIELLLMQMMYPDRRRNVLIIGASLVFGAICWFAIREQAAITDRQFLRSMIPHHAGAILMCEQNVLRDPQLASLCEQIVSSQQREIDLMRSKMEE